MEITATVIVQDLHLIPVVQNDAPFLLISVTKLQNNCKVQK